MEIFPQLPVQIAPTSAEVTVNEWFRKGILPHSGLRIIQICPELQRGTPQNQVKVGWKNSTKLVNLYVLEIERFQT